MSSQPPSNGKAEMAENPFTKLVEQTYCDMATLWLMDYDDEDKIQIASQGQFSCTLITHNIIPILIAFCRVGVLHWPVTKDAPVIRVGWRNFLFAVPGLLYGLQLPLSCCSEIMVDDIISFFRLYSDYEDHKENAIVIAYPIAEIDEQFWVEVRLPYESYLWNKLAKHGHYPGRSISTIQGKLPCIYTLSLLSKATIALAMSFLGGVLQSVHVKIYNLKRNQDGTVMTRACSSISAFISVSNAIELRNVVLYQTYVLLRHDEMMLAEDLGFEVWIVNERRLSHLVKSLYEIVQKHLDAARGNSTQEDIEDDEIDDDDSDDDDGDGGANCHDPEDDDDDDDDDDNADEAMNWRNYD